MALSASSLPITFGSGAESLIDIHSRPTTPFNRRIVAIRRNCCLPTATSYAHVPAIDPSSLMVGETVAEDELWAAACLRVRTFNNFKTSSYNVQEHQRYLAEREFEALKERVSGKREGFRRVACVNATLPLLQISNLWDLSSTCKFCHNGEDRVVVGSLDLNQCLWLPDEIAGTKPEGIDANFSRAYLSNICVAKELHRNGLGYELIRKSKIIAQEWGITDMYVHVAVNNEPAKNLYLKSGFVHESDEPAWQARYLDRPRRLLLRFDVPNNMLHGLSE